MVNKQKLLALLLAAAMLLGTLVGCGVDGTGADTSASDTTTTSAPAADTTTAAPEVETPSELNIVVDGKSTYKVIRDEDAASSAVEVTLARNILNQIKTLTGATVGLGTDWAKPGYELDSSTPEILVGVTDYPETQEVVNSLSYGDYAVRVVGNKIVVFGYDTSALSRAVTELSQLLKKYTSEDGKNITVPTEELNITGTSSKQLNALPCFEGGSFYSYYEAGAGCDEVIIRNTTLDQYNAYLQKLNNSGFACYTTNEIAGNHFATYTNAEYTVTAGYYDYETSVRLLIEPLAPAVGLESDNVYTPITTSQITMLGASHGTTNNGLSVLIRLTDGRFIIVDGGHNKAACATELIEVMKEQSKEYAKSLSDITIAAWIVTHAHGDHYGALLNYYNNFRTMKVERILVNFLSETERQKAINSAEYGKNWNGDGGAYTRMPAVAAALGAEIHQVHVGQVYYLADLKMEILYTIESFAPNICNALNTSSTVMRMEFGGETVYMSTGDATGYGMEICADMFGDHMQSDIVQVCHHGYTTWGDDAGMIDAYKIINAPTVLWPQGLDAYPSYQGKSYNKVLFEVPNYKEVYVAGAIGDQIIVPIPYTVGSAVTIRTGS